MKNCNIGFYALLWFLFSIFCFLSCTKTEPVQEKEQTKTFRTSFWEIEVPLSYSIDSADHWEMGRAYFLKNKKNEHVMTIRSGSNSVYALNEHAIYSTDEFSVNNKVDTSIYWEDKIYKERIVVLQANRLENVIIRNEPVMHNFPIMFEFICILNFFDSQTCDDIVNSAKRIHK